MHFLLTVLVIALLNLQLGAHFSEARTLAPPIHLQSVIVSPHTLPLGQKLPVIVMLHGCMQTADQFAQLTHAQELADTQKLFVVIPNQKPHRHPMHCWTWYDRHNQTRAGVEPVAIVEVVRSMQRHFPIDPERIFVAGLSAGSTMAHTLVSCYPEIFKGALLHSGPSYRSAINGTEAATVMRKGPQDSPLMLARRANDCVAPGTPLRPVLIVAGTKDRVVNARNSWQGWDVQLELAHLREPDLFKYPSELITREDQSPGGKRFVYRLFKKGKRPVVAAIDIMEMGHAWSGGKEGYPFSDPSGPDITRMMWEFFSKL